MSDSRLTIRPVRIEDYDDVRRITRDAYLEAGYFTDEAHPYVAVLSDIEHRAEHAEVWVAERDGVIVVYRCPDLRRPAVYGHRRRR